MVKGPTTTRNVLPLEHSVDAPEDLISWGDFRRKYQFKDTSLDHSGLTWSDYQLIYRTHRQNIGTHKLFRKQVCDSLDGLPQLYSLRSRIKHPEHLVAKILRKNCKSLRDRDGRYQCKSAPRITLENFGDEVTDLVGVRILTLFKADKQEIHNGLVQAWEPLEKICNFKRGDPTAAFTFLKKQGFLLREHPDGYRAWHYLVEGFLGGRKCTAEIQVRTVFEDAWSEIDHKIRYPNYLRDEAINGYLMMMNRLAGAADSIASFVFDLKLASRDQNHQDVQDRHHQIESQLQALGVDTIHNYCSKCGEALDTGTLAPTCAICLQAKAPDSWAWFAPE